MTLSAPLPRRWTCSLLLLGVAVVLCGCPAPDAQFHLNTVYVRQQEKVVGEDFELDPRHLQDVADILAAFFGTPDDPHLPTLEAVNVRDLMDPAGLRAAAGPVGSDERGRPRGLYREHCAHCHGVTGDGAGPTAAFLNPYPRDYRLGTFKFTSTPVGIKPTHQDLYRTLVDGIPGTAMPSFRLLSEPELEALVDYVKYLAIRGEVERLLISEAVNELGEEDRLVDISLRESDPEQYQEQVNILKSIVEEVVLKWASAEEEVTEVPPPPADWGSPESIAKGEALFYGPVAACVKCHGDSALGDGQVTDYDNWTKEIEPNNPLALEEYLELGALPPRNIRPRNLRQGVYRGGRRPIDLFWRVHNGIDGTPMPKVPLKADDAPPEAIGLTTDELWHLLAYVRSLPYESISKPAGHQVNYQRDRM